MLAVGLLLLLLLEPVVLFFSFTPPPTTTALACEIRHEARLTSACCEGSLEGSALPLAAALCAQARQLLLQHHAPLGDAALTGTMHYL